MNLPEVCQADLRMLTLRVSVAKGMVSGVLSPAVVPVQ